MSANAKRGTHAEKNTRRSRSKRTDLNHRGGKINVSTNPPQITYQPWYNLIIAKTHSGGLDFTPAKLVDAVKAQLDPHKHGFTDKDFRLQVRVHLVRCWNLSGRTIALAIDDYSVRNKSDQEQVCGLVDSGTALHTPACGYKLSSSLSNIVLRNDADDKDDVIIHVIAPTNNACITYVDVTWRFDGPIALTGADKWFVTDMQRLVNHSASIAQATKKISPTVSEMLGMLREQLKSGYIDTIINGITKTAEVVAVAGADDDRKTLEEICASLQRVTTLLDKDTISEVSLLSDADTSNIPT